MGLVKLYEIGSLEEARNQHLELIQAQEDLAEGKKELTRLTDRLRNFCSAWLKKRARQKLNLWPMSVMNCAPH